MGRSPVAAEKKRRRSTLPKEAAREHYVSLGLLVALEQIREDAGQLDERAFPVGPFARLDANLVAARESRTRGAISNIFGSQTAFQIETMALALSAGDWIAELVFPPPAEFPTVEAWVDAFFAAQSARGPVHGMKPAASYPLLWALWLSTLPYGLWSKRIREPSLAEYGQLVGRLETVIQGALERFGLQLRVGTTLRDLACSIASLVEGAWLNQCLTDRHPCDPQQPAAAMLVRAGRLLWHGATEPRPRRTARRVR
ncbi:MAG: hypothetical protein U1E45_12395 [Geminicoccaceae bacterium]